MRSFWLAVVHFLIVWMRYHFTYVLKLSDGDLYVGSCRNLEKRYKDHLNGRVKSTKTRRPLKLVYFEGCLSKRNAIIRENQLKTGFGRGYLKRRINDAPT